MKNSLLFILIILASCSGKQLNNSQKTNSLTISEYIDANDSTNLLIIDYLKKFLETKNESYYDNAYWAQEDFPKYYYPYLDLYNIEKKDSVDDFYRPTLLEIIKTEDDSVKLVKLAYLGRAENSKNQHLKCIYNIVATINENGIVFSNPLSYLTRNWSKIQVGNIQYINSPNRKFRSDQANNQQRIIDRINSFYKTDSLSITYYSCINAKELFNIKGFDYDHRMYLGKSGGGLAINHNIILSANNSDEYTHEILHLYNAEMFPSMPKLLNEGIATYIGGSGGFEYVWHKSRLQEYVRDNKIDFSKHLEPFEKFYIQNETSVPYMIGALICERTYRLYGHEGLFSLLNKEGDIWEVVNQFGLAKVNFNEELEKELILPPTSCMMHVQ